MYPTIKLRQPPALTTLFLIELWERASYYGMRAILTLYMAATIAAGGLGFSKETATSLYGIYTGLVYVTPLLGGFIADRYLGARRTLLLGGIVIALGHLSLVFATTTTFFLGLGLIVLGTGLLKPNVSTMVGALYKDENDERRAKGFKILYMGINVGGAIAPIVCGFLAQSDYFKGWLANHGFDPVHSWHWGFGAAGVGMLFGLLQYWFHRDRLQGIGERPQPQPKKLGEHQEFLTAGERKRMVAIAVLFAACTLFWAVFEQAGSSLALFADKLVDNHAFGWKFPSTWFASLNSVFVIGLTTTPFLAWSLKRLAGGKEPSAPFQFTLGLVFLASGTALMVPASLAALNGAVNPLWLVGVYFLQTIGELCLSPVGLDTVNRLAPKRYASMMMGVWFLSAAIGNYAAGYLAGFFDAGSPTGIAVLFGCMAAAALAFAGAMWKLTPTVNRMMATKA